MAADRLKDNILTGMRIKGRVIVNIIDKDNQET